MSVRTLPLQSCLTENWPLNHFHPLAEKEAAAVGNRVRGWAHTESVFACLTSTWTTCNFCRGQAPPNGAACLFCCFWKGPALLEIVLAAGYVSRTMSHLPMNAVICLFIKECSQFTCEKKNFTPPFFFFLGCSVSTISDSVYDYWLHLCWAPFTVTRCDLLLTSWETATENLFTGVTSVPLNVWTTILPCYLCWGIFVTSLFSRKIVRKLHLAPPYIGGRSHPKFVHLNAIGYCKAIAWFNQVLVRLVSSRKVFSHSKLLGQRLVPSFKGTKVTSVTGDNFTWHRCLVHWSWWSIRFSVTLAPLCLLVATYKVLFKGKIISLFATLFCLRLNKCFE